MKQTQHFIPKYPNFITSSLMWFETWHSRPLEHIDYCEWKADAEIVLMNMNFWSI